VRNIILSAAQLAARYHQHQKRKNNGSPYVTHLIRVAGRALTLPEATEVMGAAGFLHDSIEDQTATPAERERMSEEIEASCGGATLEMVLALTNPSKGIKAPRAERKRMDREHLQACCREVKLVKLVDRIDNLSESYTDVKAGLDNKLEFNLLYCEESELLLRQSLNEVDPALEQELRDSIEDLRLLCTRKLSADS
jgi:(p)ppGpp synthase/HD superfamily hydrolase